MATTRIPSDYEDPIINEKLFLQYLQEQRSPFPEVARLGENRFPNPCGEQIVGDYVAFDTRRYVTIDPDITTGFGHADLPVPTFPLAGPRKTLFHNPHKVTAAIVTTGGLAPGLNNVVHSIVKRHHENYDLSRQGKVLGIEDSFKGLCDLYNYQQELEPSTTESWLEKGGSMLGMQRYHTKSKADLAEAISQQLMLNGVEILYVIGGDGSLATAHEIAQRSPDISVVGIPKTMDNDVMWMTESFGFKTAVEEATEIINALNSEAESSRRVCLIELFGAESGFVASNAALASGHVDLVLIPEEFLFLTKSQCEELLEGYFRHIRTKVKRPRPNERSHAVIVIAEGAGRILKQKGVQLRGQEINDSTDAGFLLQLKSAFEQSGLVDTRGNAVAVFCNRPQHLIRTSAANTQDRILCEQLGVLAVDSALAGFTDFMISQWLNSYVLVPLDLVANRHKRLAPTSFFWKRVVNSVGQPSLRVVPGTGI
jgi:6-phosphofructokinase 1